MSRSIYFEDLLLKLVDLYDSASLVPLGRALSGLILYAEMVAIPISGEGRCVCSVQVLAMQTWCLQSTSSLITGEGTLSLDNNGVIARPAQPSWW